MGIHKRNEEWILVASDKSMTPTGEIEDLIFWSDQTTRIKYETSQIKPATREETKLVARMFLDFNSLDVVASVLGWMMAVPFKARLVSVVPQLRRQFPILLTWGERGAGKTKTAEIIILPFFGDFDGPRKIDEMTKFTFMLNSNCTNLIPLVFDEYKPFRLSQRQVQEVSSFLRSSYNALTGERGHVGAEGLGVRLYTYTAPVMLMGEASLIEPALKERIIEVVFSRDGRKGKRHIQEFMTVNLAGVGFNYIRWSLGVSDREINETWKKEFITCYAGFEDRIRQNVAIVRMGLRLWQAFLKTQEIDIEVDRLLSILDESQKVNLIGEGMRPKCDVDLILEGMSAMAAMKPQEISEGIYWRLEKDRLYLRLQILYPEFKRWAREYGFDSEVLDEASFRRRLKDQPYFVQSDAVLRMRDKGEPENSYGKTVKTVALNTSELDEAKIDLTGFGREPVPF